VELLLPVVETAAWLVISEAEFMSGGSDVGIGVTINVEATDIGSVKSDAQLTEPLY
jgi:hypothetical protein